MASTDFSEAAQSYQLCKITGYKIQIKRLFTETSNTSLIAAGIPTLKVAYFPFLGAGYMSNNVVLQNEAAFEVDPHSTTPTVHYYPQLMGVGVCSNGSTPFVMGIPFDTLAVPSTGLTYPGVLAIGWTSNGNAISTTVVFHVSIFIQCDFSLPF